MYKVRVMRRKKEKDSSEHIKYTKDFRKSDKEREYICVYKMIISMIEKSMILHLMMSKKLCRELKKA